MELESRLRGVVDARRPNDLGTYRQTDALEAVLRPILDGLKK